MRSRIAAAAVAATLVTGLAACSSASKASSGGAPAAPAASTSATAPTSTSAPASSTAFTAAQLEKMRAKVAAVFGQGVTVRAVYTQPDIDSKELAADFDSPATMTAVWGSGPAGSDRPMLCGMTKYNGIVIGTVQPADDGTATVPVLLYQGSKAGSAVTTVTLDATSGLIKGTACGGATNAADFPGIAPIAAYYGATVDGNLSVVNDKSDPDFTQAFAAWEPADSDYDKPTCSQSGPDRWIVALTGATASSSAWDFAPQPVRTLPDPTVPSSAVGFGSSLAVDLGASKISRVTCFRANPPAADSTHSPDYAMELLDYYRLAADQKSLGVDAEAAIRPFFVSDAAFATAWQNTGTVPLLCTKKIPGSVGVAEGSTPTTSGSHATVKMVTWPDWHPDAPGQEASKFTVVFDTSTMKISSITCA